MDNEQRQLVHGAAGRIRLHWCNTLDADPHLAHNIFRARWDMITLTIKPLVSETDEVINRFRDFINGSVATPFVNETARVMDFFREYYRNSMNTEPAFNLSPIDAFEQALPAALTYAKINIDDDPELVEDFTLISSCLVNLRLDGEFWAPDCLPLIEIDCDDGGSGHFGGPKR